MSGAENNPAAMDAAPAGLAPGVRLAEARRAQNLTPAEIARQLKLSVWQVEALEAGRYQQLPGRIFVRGFVRNYAKLVKLDPNELLRAAGDSLPQSVSRPERPPPQDIPFPARHPPRWPMLAATVAILVGVLVAYEFYWNEPELAGTQAASVAPAPAARSKSESAPAPPQPAGDTRTVQPEAEIPVAAAAQATQGGQPGSDPGALPEPDKPPKAGERRVRMDFDQESWVEIRDRNERVIFSQLNRPGTQQFVSGKPPFSVVVGNAHGVRLTYEDKPVDLASHTKVDVARLVLR